MSSYLKRVLLLMAIMEIASSGALAGTAIIKVLDNCQGEFFEEIGPYKAESDNNFLVVEIDIEFAGTSSDSFFVDASVFNALVDGIEYPYSIATFSLDSLDYSPLSTVTLRNGEKTTGHLAFEVPDGTTEFKIKYVGKEEDIVPTPVCA
jgi:hypothetical protein